MTVTLSGSLTEFSVADVLNLLGMGRRTALVQLHGPDATGEVWLIDGTVCAASADSRRARLLRAVVATLDVAPLDVANALTAAHPAQALVDAGVVDRDDACAVASELCVDAMGELLGWAEGAFEVHVGAGEPEDLGVRLEVHDCVDSARDRAQQWSDLRSALPDAGTVLALAPTLAHAPVVDLEDWSVLAQVDGRRTFAEVLAVRGMAPLAAGARLVELIGRGLVAAAPEPSDERQLARDAMLDQFEARRSLDPSGRTVVAPAEVEPVLVASTEGSTTLDEGGGWAPEEIVGGGWVPEESDPEVRESAEFGSADPAEAFPSVAGQGWQPLEELSWAAAHAGEEPLAGLSPFAEAPTMGLPHGYAPEPVGPGPVAPAESQEVPLGPEGMSVSHTAPPVDQWSAADVPPYSEQPHGAYAVTRPDMTAQPDTGLGIVAWETEAWEGEPPVQWQGETWDAEPALSAAAESPTWAPVSDVLPVTSGDVEAPEAAAWSPWAQALGLSAPEPALEEQHLPEQIAPEAVAPAEDPLATGLLAHLMSTVRSQ